MAEDPAEPVDARPLGPPMGRDLVEALVERARIRVAWLGAARLAGAAGALLVVAGLGWWLLRSPSLPTEAALPPVTHPAVDPAAPPGDVDAPAVAIDVATTSSTPGTIVVHVTGAVNQPGVYELTAGQRVEDALAAAGGPTARGDPNALNLAAPVADGDRIEVPILGNASSAPSAGGITHSPAGTGGSTSTEPVDLNAATPDDLERLPGIGPATATAIVEFREHNGPFSSIDQLLDVPGIGPAKLDAIRDLVTT